jgi:hypothetical protein
MFLLWSMWSGPVKPIRFAEDFISKWLEWQPAPADGLGKLDNRAAA